MAIPVIYRGDDTDFRGRANLALNDNLMVASDDSFNSAFEFCVSLTNMAFNNLTYAGNGAFKYAFYGCASLTNVDFTKLETAGTNSFYAAFSQCADLKHIDFGRLTQCKEKAFVTAFSGCDNITNINFGALKDIAYDSFDSAFDACLDLQYADFHSLSNKNKSSHLSGPVISLTSNAPLIVNASNITDSIYFNFSACTNLRKVRLDNVAEIVSFSNGSSQRPNNWIPWNGDCRYYVPVKLVDAWRSAAGWSSYSADVVIAAEEDFTEWVYCVDTSEPYEYQYYIESFILSHDDFLIYRDQGSGPKWKTPYGTFVSHGITFNVQDLDEDAADATEIMFKVHFFDEYSQYYVLNVRAYREPK